MPVVRDGGGSTPAPVTRPPTIPPVDPAVGASLPASPPEGYFDPVTGSPVGLPVQTPAAEFPRSDAQVEDWIRRYYGYMAGWLNNPEIRQLLFSAAREGIRDPGLLYGRLYQTNWWKTTSRSQREWEQKVNEDPAEVQRLIDAKVAQLRDMASVMGVTLGGDIRQLAERSLSMGWSPTEEIDYLVGYAPTTSRFNEGMLGAYQNQLKAEAARYLVALDDATSADYARRIARQEMTLDGARAVFAAQARSRFGNDPDLAKVLDEGVTPADFFSQHRSVIANTLEVAPESIDFVGDQRWWDVLSHADENGKVRPMTLTEAARFARGDARYAGTSQANQLMADTGLQALRILGYG